MSTRKPEPSPQIKDQSISVSVRSDSLSSCHCIEETVDGFPNIQVAFDHVPSNFEPTKPEDSGLAISFGQNVLEIATEQGKKGRVLFQEGDEHLDIIFPEVSGQTIEDGDMEFSKDSISRSSSTSNSSSTSSSSDFMEELLKVPQDKGSKGSLHSGPKMSRETPSESPHLQFKRNLEQGTTEWS